MRKRQRSAVSADGNERKPRRSFEEFWDKRGFSILLCACLAVVGLTAWFTRSGQGEEGDAVAPSVTVYATPTPTPRPAALQGATILPSATPLPLVCPADKMKVGMVYSADRLVYCPAMGDWRCHEGVDFLGEEGDVVRALLAGTVEDVYVDPYLGSCVRLAHGDGYSSLYACLYEEIPVKKGDAVSAGQPIALMGDSGICESGTGWHVHIELWKDGQAQRLQFE